MPHIDLKNELPGIRGLMQYSPETAAPLNDLAEMLLHSPANSLSTGDRELIGAYVSALNECRFCNNVHAAMAAHYYQCDLQAIDAIQNDYQASSLSDKMKSLIAIAGCVQRSGKHVTEIEIANARTAGATDREIHDTVLIAAAFCMFNRYVDGLATLAPEDRNIYKARAAARAEEGYAQSHLKFK